MRILRETINRQDAIDKFQELLKLKSSFRFLWLTGDEKSGKTHLVTKVFPAIVQKSDGVQCAVLDVSEESTTSDILNSASAQLGGSSIFVQCYEAQVELMSRPRIEVKGLRAVFSNLQFRSEGVSERQSSTHYLVSRFVGDLGQLGDVPVVFLIDVSHLAKESTKAFLANTLLVHLAGVPHVRAVVACRELPAPSGSYAAEWDGFKLQPVEEEEAYIAYCREIGADLDEQWIRRVAYMFDYMPGLFVDRVRPKFGRAEVARGF